MNKDFNFIVKLTTGCPGNCKCCRDRQENFKLKNEKNSIFDINTFEKICKNIKKLNGSYICISGGEPTIVKNIDDYIKIAKKYGLATRINTNGWNVTRENLELWLKNGLDQIVLSIYGLDEKSIIETRGNRLIFDKSLRAAETIKELRNKYKFIFIIQTIIMKDNYKQMPELLNYAIDKNVNLFWPSYLEDAINLPEIRVSSEEINDFKNNIIPRMKKIINDRVVDDNIKENIIRSLNSYYNDGTELYKYHKNNENCHWSGKHFTFYPNGTIDPCPGHEYFKSEYQYKINYEEIDEFMKLENLNKCKKICFEYCKYCPQGVHHEISFMPVSFNEHDSREEI